MRERPSTLPTAPVVHSSTHLAPRSGSPAVAAPHSLVASAFQEPTRPTTPVFISTSTTAQLHTPFLGAQSGAVLAAAALPTHHPLHRHHLLLVPSLNTDNAEVLDTLAPQLVPQDRPAPSPTITTLNACRCSFMMWLAGPGRFCLALSRFPQ